MESIELKNRRAYLKTLKETVRDNLHFIMSFNENIQNIGPEFKEAMKQAKETGNFEGLNSEDIIKYNFFKKRVKILEERVLVFNGLIKDLEDK